MQNVYAVSLTNPLNSATVYELLIKVAEVVFQMVIPIVAIFIIYAGYLFVTARGNEEQLRKAKLVIMWTLAGAILVLGARVIAEAVVNTVDSF